MRLPLWKFWCLTWINTDAKSCRKLFPTAWGKGNYLVRVSQNPTSFEFCLAWLIINRFCSYRWHIFIDSVLRNTQCSTTGIIIVFLVMKFFIKPLREVEYLRSGFIKPVSWDIFIFLENTDICLFGFLHVSFTNDNVLNVFKYQILFTEKVKQTKKFKMPFVSMHQQSSPELFCFSIWYIFLTRRECTNFLSEKYFYNIRFIIMPCWVEICIKNTKMFENLSKNRYKLKGICTVYGDY